MQLPVFPPIKTSGGPNIYVCPGHPSLVFAKYQPFCMVRVVGVNPSTSQKWTTFEPRLKLVEFF
jgi:hypothetical protein